MFSKIQSVQEEEQFGTDRQPRDNPRNMLHIALERQKQKDEKVVVRRHMAAYMIIGYRMSEAPRTSAKETETK